MTDRYERITWRGRTFDRYTVAALQEAERRLGRELTFYQGSYSTGVSNSAGTHDGGGAVDCWCPGVSGRRTARVLRGVGFAAWHRPARDGVWGRHVHGVQIDNARLSPAAQRQVAEYRAGGDGLAGSAPDPDPYRPPVTFHYEEDDMTPEQLLDVLRSKEGKAAIAEAVRSLKIETIAADGSRVDEYVGSVLRGIKADVDALTRKVG
ncbi:MAG TPA: hypothetical protein VGE43_14940 [Acidimicrobiales bacterium]